MLNKFLELRHYRQDQLNDDFTYKRRSFVQFLSNFTYKIIHSIRLISATDSKFVIIFFFIWLIILLILYQYRIDGFFFNNIFPELFGFGLEGLLLAGFFTFLIERKGDREKENIRLSLRKLLIPYINHIEKFYNQKSSTYKTDINDPETLYCYLKVWSLQFFKHPRYKKIKQFYFLRNIQILF